MGVRGGDTCCSRDPVVEVRQRKGEVQAAREVMGKAEVGFEFLRVYTCHGSNKHKHMWDLIFDSLMRKNCCCIHHRHGLPLLSCAQNRRAGPVAEEVAGVGPPDTGGVQRSRISHVDACHEAEAEVRMSMLHIPKILTLVPAHLPTRSAAKP